MMLSAPVRSTPYSLLMVDDNKMGMSARKAVCEELGHKVTAVSSPDEALRRASEAKFDLLVTDYRMDGMNGVDLIKSVREIQPAIPVILLSGFVDVLGLDEANTGANAVIQKSANEVSHLVRALKSLLKPGRKPVRSQAPATRKRAKKA